MKRLGILSRLEVPFASSRRLSLKNLTYDGDLNVELVDVSSDMDVEYSCRFGEVECFKVTNESYYNSVWPDGFDSRYWGRAFTISSSSWIQELRADPVFQVYEESCGDELRHFLIICLDEIVEVLACSCWVDQIPVPDGIIPVPGPTKP